MASSWVSIVLWVITNAPTLLLEVKKVLDIIHTLPGSSNHTAALLAQQEISSAVVTGSVESVGNALNVCVGRIGCAPELK